MLYELQNASLSLGGQTILSSLDFAIKGQEKIAIVGRNGCGKTTLLRLIAGELSLDRDDKRLGPGIFVARNTTIEMLHQNPFPEKDETVEELIGKLCKDFPPYSKEQYDFMQEYDCLFTGFGFAKDAKKKKLSEFSGGEQTKIALIRLLLKKPDILLLDEPTNHLDLPTVQWLEEYLRAYPKAVVMVSHDRYFLDQCAKIVYELSDGKATRYVGNYSDYKKEREKRRRVAEKNYLAQQKEIERLSALIEKFKHKPSKASMARSKKKVLERMQLTEKPRLEGAHLFTQALEPLRQGNKWVLEACALRFGYQKEQPLGELSLRVKRGQKIGILGVNGAGKTTLLQTLRGQLAPLEGSLSLGSNIQMGYFDQHSAEIQTQQRVFEHFGERFPKLTTKEIKELLGQYLFFGRESGKQICELSGGEKARLILAETLEARPNLLLLDEPTNHMDIPAKETLESAFQMYQGTMLFISHDRYFLKEIADAFLIFEGDQLRYYPFGYEHYMEKLRRQKEYKGKAGSNLVTEENQLLLQGFHDVPEKKRIQSARLNTEQSYTDWQLSLMEEDLIDINDRAEYVWNQRDEVLFYEQEEQKRAWQEAWEDLVNERTKLLLDWYDKYCEYEEAFESYRDL